jgi:hypothetical protein
MKIRNSDKGAIITLVLVFGTIFVFIFSGLAGFVFRGAEGLVHGHFE